MNDTHWYGGPSGSITLPEGVVSTSYILVEHECPSPTLATGYVDTEFQKVFNTELKYKSGTLKVYINLEEIEDFEPTTDQAFKINGNHTGYLTISYTPKDEAYYYGDYDMYNTLRVSTNIAIYYIQTTAKVIDQIRYAVNQMEKEIDTPQTRWTGGVFSDEFNVAVYDEDDDIERSNLIGGSTEITPQMFYEITVAVKDIASAKSINIREFTEDIYSKMGITNEVIEWMRRTINQMEAIL